MRAFLPTRSRKNRAPCQNFVLFISEFENVESLLCIYFLSKMFPKLASLVNFQSSCFQFYNAMWKPQRKYWKLTWKHEFKRARELFRTGKSWMREYRSLSDENDIFPFSDSRPLLIGKNRYFTASLLIPTPSSFLKSGVILGWKCGRMAPP